MLNVDHEPLSWLLLERYALGELSAAERARVEAVLARSERDRNALESITADTREMPPLPRVVRRGPWAYGAGAILAAAAATLVVRVVPSALQPAAEAPQAGTKGSAITLALVSDVQGDAPRSFAAGERFKVRITCPKSQSGALGLVVFQGGARFEPLARGGLECGENLASWPGAFALDGADEAVVCVLWGEALGRAQGPEDVAGEGVCERLHARDVGE